MSEQKEEDEPGLAQNLGQEEAREQMEKQGLGLAWRDYVAIFLASLETVGLPFVVLITVVGIIAFLIRRF